MGERCVQMTKTERRGEAVSDSEATDAQVWTRPERGDDSNGSDDDEQQVALPVDEEERGRRDADDKREEDATDDDDDETSPYPPWMRRGFAHEQLASVAALRHDQSLVSEGAWRRCDECCRRAAAFQCRECEQALCFTCADAIHIIPSLSSHALVVLVDPTATPPPATASLPALPARGHAACTPRPVVHLTASLPSAADAASVVDSAPTQFCPATQIEARLHLPVGTKLFFRQPDCGRWARELLHGAVVGLDHGVRSSSDAAQSPTTTYFYRVLWLRGVDALANGFFRASLVLPTPCWPVEVGLFPSQLSAFRAVLTAERLARAALRRERVGGRWHAAATRHGAFPSVDVVNEILDATETQLGQEFRTRLTQQDDAAFLRQVSAGAWGFAQWMERIGRASELTEEAVAVQELDDELRTMRRADAATRDGDEPLSPAAELLLLWSPRGRMRFFLLEQRELLLPGPVQRAHVASIVRQMLFVYVGFAWHRWRKVTARHRRAELKRRRGASAARLQMWWRRCLERERTRRQQRDGALHAAVSPLDALALYPKRQAQAATLYRFVSRQYEDRQRRALRRWALHALGSEETRRDAQASLALREARVARGAWHPSHGIASLPRLPRMYAHRRPDGGVAIENATLFQQFRASHAGPTDSSYWVVRHRVLAGAYPAGVPAFRDARRMVSRADYATSVLLQEIGVVVCLAEPSELEAHEPSVDASWLLQQQQRRSPRSAALCHTTPWLFERIVRAKHSALSVELTNAVKMSERLEELAQRELDDGGAAPLVLLLPADALAHGETLANKLALAQQNVRKARETLAQLKPLEFLLFPIPRDGVPRDVAALEAFLVSLEDRLRRQQRVFLFSMHGHGRTGLVAALLLGRLYGLTATDALDRAQRLHDCAPARPALAVSSPHAACQATLVTQLLARWNDAAYAPVVRENGRGGFVEWRAQQRGVSIDKFAARDGFMVSEPVAAAAQQQQQREHARRQRIAQRESAAARLTFARRRQQREARAMASEDASW